MIRDFSKEAKYILYENIDSINPASSYEGIWDYFSDAKGSTKEWIWKLSIAGLLDGVDSYHKLVSERQEVNKAEIDKIFTDVQRVDAKYAGYFSEINEALKSKVDFINRMAETIAIKDQVEFAAATSSLSTALLDTKEDEVEILIKAYKNGLITEFSGEQRAKLEKFAKGQSARLGQDIARDGEEEKRESQWLLVDVYRALNPDIAKKFDTLLDSGNEPIKEFDRYNIMYIAYTADEPFRELFFKTLGMYTLGDVTYSGTSFYTHAGNTKKSIYATVGTVNINYETSMYYSDKGPYNSFFHECGHAIDYQVGNENAYSREYQDGTNYDVMCDDVYTFIEGEIHKFCEENRNTISYEQEKTICDNIINYIKGLGYGEYSLTGDDAEVFNAVQESMKEQLKAKGTYEAESQYVQNFKAYIHAGISDAYSGVTNNIITGDKYHSDIDDEDKDKDGNVEEYTYWYDIKPPYDRLGKHETEMFAHYFSFGITGTKEAMDDMRYVYLPNTMKRYDEMASDIVLSLQGN